MRYSYLLLLSLLVLQFSCIQHNDSQNDSVIELTIPEVFSVNYAKGFELEKGNGFIKIITKSFGANTFFRDSIYIVYHDTIQLPNGVKAINGTVQSLACQSTTHIAFINQLGKTNLIKGICGLNYVVNDGVKQILKNNNAFEICLTEKVDTESLLGSGAELFTIYPFGIDVSNDKSYGALKSLFIAEYLEESQLARLEWVKLFGLLLGEPELANAYFQEVEANYLKLKSNNISQEKSFIMNVPFNEIWYMPSPQSVGVQLIEDAGLNYFYADTEGTENISLPKETVWNDGVSADYWFIIAERPQDFTLADLVKEEEVYAEFKSVKEGQVYFCNTVNVDYFAQGTIEPDVILKDIQAAAANVQFDSKYFKLLK
ncbi:ABC transporter substrate-binding protein [Crocinitomix catalasitica]|uniref:ABC transporter substrate-binding protein n=1 Tax=Crocinitomix catalasitica TaxID=184607 RepID=UPI000487624D|nr:ABC transporter substrate-binding protein [Crocinitomix catalasitica]